MKRPTVVAKVPKYDERAKRTYQIVGRGMKPPSSNWSDIKCSFCGAVVRAFHWSLFGCGKKCTCGAKHNGYGYTMPQTKRKGTS